MDRAWGLQHRIDKRIADLPELTLESYLFYVVMIFFVLGFGLFIFCLLFNINPLATNIVSCPLHYLVLGMGFFVLYLYIKTKDTHK